MAFVKKRPAKSRSEKTLRTIKPGGVAKYIAACPKEVRPALKAIRAAIREAAPHAIETLSYFNIPGYAIKRPAHEDYSYNGMFVWFSIKSSLVRLHLRPSAILKHRAGLKTFVTTKAIVSFPTDKPIPLGLVKKLVRASLKDMITSLATKKNA